MKVPLLKFILWHWNNNLGHATMLNTFAPDVLNSLQNKNRCTCTVH